MCLGFLALTGYISTLPVTFGVGQVVKMAVHSSIGILLLGLSSLSLLILQKHIKPLLLLPFLVTFVFLTIAFLTWQTIKRNNHLNLELFLNQKIDNASLLFKNNMYNYTTAFSRITQRWIATPEGTPKAVWMTDAQNYIRDQAGYIAIEWIDKNYVVQMAMPESIAKNIIGFDLSKDIHRKSALIKSVATGELVLSNTLDLIQGERGFLMISPIIMQKTVQGFMIGVLNNRILLGKIFQQTDPNNDYNIKMWMDEQLVFSRFELDRSDMRAWTRAKAINLHDHKWTLQITPTIKLYNKIVSTTLERLSLILGVIISLLLGVITNFIMRFKVYQSLIKQSHEHLVGIIDTPKELIAALDSNYNFIIFNQSYYNEMFRIFNVRLAVGMNWQELANKMHPENKLQFESLWQRALGGESFTTIIKLHTRGSRHENFDFHFNILYDSSNNVMGASHIARNIDARIESENEVLDDRNKLKLLVSDLEIKNNELSLLKELVTILNINETIEQFINIFEHYCPKIFPNTAGILYLCIEDTKEFILKTQWNSPNSTTSNFFVDECYALLLNRSYLMSEKNNDLVCYHANNLVSNSYICIPLLAREKKLGLLYLEPSPDLKFGSNKNFEFMQLIAEQISLVLYNIQLKEYLKNQSTYDALTGLYNRRQMDEYISHEMAISKRYMNGFWIMLADIDHFKKINDNFGHPVGDLVIKKVAMILKKHFRESDLVARWGGEEFLILIKEISLDSLKIKSEKLRADVEKNHFAGLDKDLKVTISMGLAEFQEFDTIDDIVKKADDALYMAKNTGRNKFVIYNKRE